MLLLVGSIDSGGFDEEDKFGISKGKGGTVEDIGTIGVDRDVS